MLLSRFFIYLNTNNIPINKISFTLEYNKNEIDSHLLLILPQPVFSSQTVTNDIVNEPDSNNIVHIRYAIVNKNLQQPKSFGQGIVIVNFFNLHSPETVTFTLSDISYTNAENQVVALPNYTQSYAL